MQVALSQNCE
jgi:phage-related protein